MQKCYWCEMEVPADSSEMFFCRSGHKKLWNMFIGYSKRKGKLTFDEIKPKLDEMRKNAEIENKEVEELTKIFT